MIPHATHAVRTHASVPMMGNINKALQNGECEQIVRFTTIVRTEGAGMPIEDVWSITERAENIGYARRLSRIELDHE